LLRLPQLGQSHFAQPAEGSGSAPSGLAEQIAETARRLKANPARKGRGWLKTQTPAALAGRVRQDLTRSPRAGTLTRLALTLTLALAGSAAVGKDKLPPPIPLPELAQPVVISTTNYDVSKFVKLRPHCDTSEKVARALNDQFHLGYDAKKKGDRRLIVVSGKRLEIRANSAEHELIRRFLETGGVIAR